MAVFRVGSRGEHRQRIEFPPQRKNRHQTGGEITRPQQPADVTHGKADGKAGGRGRGQHLIVSVPGRITAIHLLHHRIDRLPDDHIRLRGVEHFRVGERIHQALADDVAYESNRRRPVIVVRLPLPAMEGRSPRPVAGETR